MNSSKDKINLIKKNISNLCCNVEKFSLDFTFLIERGFRSILAVGLNNFFENSKEFQNTYLFAEPLMNEGYADICIPIHHKKNLYIECKMWTNASIIIDAFCQLITYTSHRTNDDELVIIIFRNKHLIRQLNKKTEKEYKEALVEARNDNVVKIRDNINEWLSQQKISKVIEDFNQKNNYEWEFGIINKKTEKPVKITLFMCHCPVQNHFKCKNCNKMFELQKPKREVCSTCHDKKNQTIKQ
ncbi:hypothetical protein [Italian clover phyllody phytoplasma]|uniref:hypothetical protein n=1 Tax=Italian clover phyllody phytoplasma TaxID=1196420 RepID=UPI0002F111D8|nr:hypothetical protein [Italian clover phyllody phytoplasma]